MHIATQIPLASLTTLKAGGLARWFVEPNSRNGVQDAIRFALDKNISVFTLGRGSNVVISDEGWNGLVIRIASRFDRIDWNGATVVCESGAGLHSLVKESVNRGLQGIECLGWIPGSMGGAVTMNAGAFGQSIGAVVTAADVVDCDTGALVTLTAVQLSFGYRMSLLQGRNRVVAAVHCTLNRATDADEVARRFKEVFGRRREKQPLDSPNCGSVFKNPTGQSAGSLLEQCGLKGHAIGGVQVSEKHANFFVNTGNGRAEDFRRLCRHAQQTVYDRFAVLLEPEVLFVGDFDTPLFAPR